MLQEYLAAAVSIIAVIATAIAVIFAIKIVLYTISENDLMILGIAAPIALLSLGITLSWGKAREWLLSHFIPFPF